MGKSGFQLDTETSLQGNDSKGRKGRQRQVSITSDVSYRLINTMESRTILVKTFVEWQGAQIPNRMRLCECQYIQLIYIYQYIQPDLHASFRLPATHSQTGACKLRAMLLKKETKSPIFWSVFC